MEPEGLRVIDYANFQFLEPPLLRDRELTAELADKVPADLVKNWAPCYEFDLYIDGVEEPVGGVRVRIGNTESIRMYAGHIGYGIEPAWRGHHFAERGVRLLLPFIKQHGITTLWITCNPDNWPSRRTCERLGGEMVEIVPLPPDNEMYLRGERQKCRYRFEI